MQRSGVERWSPFLGPVRLSGIPARRLSAPSVIEAFPDIKTIPTPGATATPDDFGFKLAGVGQGVIFSGGGIALGYASQFLPGPVNTVALVGGVGLLGYGVFQFYQAVSGRAEPSVQKFTAAPDLPKDILASITGKILEPADGGKAQISNMWSAIFEEKRTFKVKFAVSNTGDKTVPVMIELRTEQVSRPWVGDPEVSNFSTNYVAELGPGDTQVFPVNQPMNVLENPLTPQSYRSQDVTAILTARTSANGAKKQLDKVAFTV